MNIEETVLGILFLDNSKIEELEKYHINSDSFIEKIPKMIFESIESLHKSDISVITPIEIESDLKKRNISYNINIMDYISELTLKSPPILNYAYYFDQLSVKNLNRIVRTSAEEHFRKLFIEGDKSQMEMIQIVDSIAKIKQNILDFSHDIQRGYNSEALSTIVEHDIWDMENNPKKVTDFYVGIHEIDSFLQFRRGILSILWSFTGMGKTTLSLNFMLKWLIKDLRVIYFALEQKASDVFKIMISILGGFPRNMWSNREEMASIRSNPSKNDKLKETINILSKFNNLKIIDDAYISVDNMLLESHKFKADVVVIDNMNNIDVGADFREAEYRRISSKLNKFAIDKDVLVILIQQSNSNVERPTSINGLKYAKGTSEEASIVLGVYVPSEDYNYPKTKTDWLDKTMKEKNFDKDSVMYLYVNKSRNSGKGGFILKYDKPTGKVESMSRFFQ